MRNPWSIFLLCFVFLSLGQRADASSSETLGTFRFSQFSLAPQIRVEEPSRGGFELREAWMGFEWEKDKSLGGTLSLGSSDLTTPAIWYSKSNNQINFVEAFVVGRSAYFDIKAGLLPIAMGYEGALPEWEWQLPMTRVRDHRWFVRRDYGIEVKAETKPFLTRVAVHNGESGENLDQKMWSTFLWQYQNFEGYGVLSTAQVGRTAPVATSANATAISDEGFYFDAHEPSKYRHGTLAFYRKWQRNLVLLEGGRGENLQHDDKNPFAWGHFDICANLGGDLNLLFRYEQSQADVRRTETMIKTLGLGFSAVSEDRMSSVTLFTQKNFEDPEKENDQAFLIFRLNSKSL